MAEGDRGDEPIARGPIDEEELELDALGRRFIERVEAEGPLPAGKTGMQVTAAVLCALSRRVDDAEARVLIQALPPTLHTQFAPCEAHGERPREPFDLAAARDDVAAHLQVAPSVADELIQTVLDTMRADIPPQELEG
ncbi:MAG: hypothetical protein JWM53_533, partial [bacterium]|nr:hypothetical protein [bacterium]